ncbi:CrcB family protein [Leucobacter sp. NPDC077196]|uniref:fluoride efflux transporter FluC n=1 Tax=Leucobacter sp. NPDC077196 TaxID=3154959 RepID=UPI00341F3AA3
MTRRKRLTDVGVVALGGAVGSLARVAVSNAMGAPAATGGFPLATLTVNLIGALALGALVAVAVHRGGPRWHRARLLLGTGVLGGFTTYSLLASDLATALLEGQVALALGYAAATVLGGAVVSGLGLCAGRWIAETSGRRGLPAEHTR